MSQQATPTTSPGLATRRSDFDTICEALDYAAQGVTGLNFFSAKGDLDRVLTYAELRERARDFGQGLVKLGLAKGDRVLLIADTDPDFMVAFCGCQYAGVLPVPVAVPTTLGGRAAYVDQLRHQLTGSGWFMINCSHSLPSFEEIMNKYVEFAVHKNGGAKDKTARDIKIDRKTLYRRLQQISPNTQ